MLLHFRIQPRITLAPLLAAPLTVQVHVAAALVVATLTPVQFWGFRKGRGPHRAAGYLWLAAMLIVALSSFWIRGGLPLNYMGFSPTHLLSVLTLFSVYFAIRYARDRNISGHRKTLIFLAASFWIAGALTFAPEGRIMALIAAG